MKSGKRDFQKELESSLPSKAKALLKEYFLRKLQESPINVYGNPIYGYMQAMDEVEVEGSLLNIRKVSFDAAMAEYDSLYPKAWNEVEQRYVRQGLSSTPCEGRKFRKVERTD